MPKNEAARGWSRRAILAGAAALAATGPGFAQSAAWPEKAVRIIVPLAPGGSVDLVARIVAEQLSAQFGRQVVIENLAGGGGTIGTGVAAKAGADGYTLVMGSSSTFGVNPSLMKNLPYDAKKDFEPISLVSFAPNLMVVPPSLGVNTLAEFVALAKKKPGELSFASSGTGGSPHLAGELFKREAGIDIIHIPYKGSGQAMSDLLAGRVSMSFATVIATQEQVAAGKLKALAITSKARMDTLPDVPTMAEAGFPGVQITAWNGLLAPAGTPTPIVEKIAAAVQQALRLPAVADRLRKDGAVPVGSTPAEFRTYIADEIERWGRVIREANIVPE